MTRVQERMRDKVVFLSGATGGLGRAIAERLAEGGAHTVLTDLDPSVCLRLVDELGGTPGRHLAAGLDVAEEAQWVSVAEVIQRNVNAIRKGGGIPSANHPNYTWAISASDLMQVTDLGLNLLLLGVHAALPALDPTDELADRHLQRLDDAGPPSVR